MLSSGGSDVTAMDRICRRVGMPIVGATCSLAVVSDKPEGAVGVVCVVGVKYDIRIAESCHNPDFIPSSGHKEYERLIIRH